ncbi:MAG: guanine deaminase [Burkholderiales bacterium]
MTPAHRNSATKTSSAPHRLALRGDLLDFTGAPDWSDLEPSELRFRADHWLLMEGGRIQSVAPGEQAPDPTWQRVDMRGKLILPGFIDTHVHSAQLDVIASHGTGLLEWLKTYTYPAEQRCAYEGEASASAKRFVGALLAHGTTSAVVVPTVHKVSADTLFEAAQARGMRLITGKVLMNRHAPEGLRDDVEQAEQDCRELIKKWHGHGRLAYAVTVRFAPTSTPEQLDMAGRLLAEHPGVYMQTHLSETRDEVQWVYTLFPEARSYLDVYARAGLLGQRSIFAHGIWLDSKDRQALQEAGASIAHCPSSNLFLGSGLFDWPRAEREGVAVTLATDVGAGTSLCLLRTMAEGYKVQAMLGHRLSAWSALHAATRGAAQALHLGHEIGRLEPGLMADVCVWDWAVGSVAEHRMALARALHERCFSWLTLADERYLVQTYVAGVVQYQR